MRYTMKMFAIALIKNNKRFFVILVLSGIFTAIIFPLTPYLLGVIVDQVKILGPDHQLTLKKLWLPVAAFIVLNIFNNINGYFAERNIAKGLAKIEFDTIYEMFDYLTGQSYRYFENNHTGYLTNKITNVFRSIRWLLFAISYMFPQILTVIASCIFMAIVNP